MSTDPIEPTYSLPSVGRPLVPYDGRTRMANGEELTLRIWSPLSLNPPTYRVGAEGLEPPTSSL